jgi:methylmalonyl-CoA/ethylmalonyl-CoA epimerase
VVFEKIHHIGIVVGDLAEAMDAYSVGLGLVAEEIVEIHDVQLRVAVLQAGCVKIELLEYGDPEIPIVELLCGNKKGLNHICYEVDNLEEAIEQLKSRSFGLVRGFPRKGVHGTVAFLIPPHNHDERIEILEVDHE